MPKYLCLMRHAEAAVRERWQDDKNRELTQAGMSHSLHLGAWFLQENMNFDLIITSSAMRAARTAELAAQGMKLESPRILLEDLLYDASVRQLLQYVNNIEDAYSTVLLVGHNPSLSYLAEYLTKANVGEMSPASGVMIRFDLKSWKLLSENTGQVVKSMSPVGLNAG